MTRSGLPDTAGLFGLRIWSRGLEAAAARLEADWEDATRQARVVVTPNLDHVARLARDASLLASYQGADYLLPDGWPVVVVARLLGRSRVMERVAGADLVPVLCARLARRRGRIFVLGGPAGSESDTLERLAKLWPELACHAFAPPHPFDPLGSEAREAEARIREVAPELVFVCLGSPRQELFALSARGRLPVHHLLCVGGAMECTLGRARRAPPWMRATGLEWLFRLAAEPGRLWDRYLLGAPRFLGAVVTEVRSHGLGPMADPELTPPDARPGPGQ